MSRIAPARMRCGTRLIRLKKVTWLKSHAGGQAQEASQEPEIMHKVLAKHQDLGKLKSPC